MLVFRKYDKGSSFVVRDDFNLGVYDIYSDNSIYDLAERKFLDDVESSRYVNLLDLSEYSFLYPKVFAYDSKEVEKFVRAIKLNNYYTSWGELVLSVLSKVLNKSLSFGDRVGAKFFIFFNIDVVNNEYFRNFFYSLKGVFSSLFGDVDYYVSFVKGGKVRILRYKNFDYLVSSYMRIKDIDVLDSYDEVVSYFYKTSYFRKLDFVVILHGSDFVFNLKRGVVGEEFLRYVVRKSVFMNLFADNKVKVLSSELYKTIYPKYRFNLIFSKLYKIFEV